MEEKPVIDLNINSDEKSQEEVKNNSKSIQIEQDKKEKQIEEDLFPLTLFLKEIENQDQEQKEKSIKNLYQVALALGEEKTRIFLIPFLEELIQQPDNQDISQLIIQQLPSLQQSVGSQHHLYLLLDILIDKLTKKSSEINQDALQSYLKIIKGVDINLIQKTIKDNISRLLQNNDLTQKETIIKILPFIFNDVSQDAQQDWMQVLNDFSNDSVPMVKKCLAINLPEFINNLSQNYQQDLLKIFDNLLQDSNDFVRFPLLESLICYIQKNDVENIKESKYFEYFKSIIEDKSNKVKGSVIINFEKLYEVFDLQILEDIMIPFVQEMLKSTDRDNKILFLKKADVIQKVLAPGCFMQNFEESLQLLIKDKNYMVKQNIGESLINILKGFHEYYKENEQLDLGNKQENIDKIEKMAEEYLILADKEGAYKFLQKVDCYSIFSQKMEDSLIQTVKKVITNKKWRLKSTAIQGLTKIIKGLKLQKLSEQIHEIILEQIQNNVYIIRREAINCLISYLQNVGEQVFFEEILNKYDEIKNKQDNYLIRINYALIIEQSIDYVSISFLENKLQNYLQTILEDKVANIQLIGVYIVSKVIEIINKQQNKDDQDFQKQQAQFEQQTQDIYKYLNLDYSDFYEQKDGVSQNQNQQNNKKDNQIQNIQNFQYLKEQIQQLIKNTQFKDVKQNAQKLIFSF